jgi:hypothetical protein
MKIVKQFLWYLWEKRIQFSYKTTKVLHKNFDHARKFYVNHEIPLQIVGLERKFDESFLNIENHFDFLDE